ncbi:PDZ domain-containing protein [Rubritalea marina]|uniref:PDZ domain-containing protein n=1 Tax=Rubritalea marina TaxID=361055 RepID=UPI0014613C16|nr:PDZ domain-containing protein [Rubritalea marina]
MATLPWLAQAQEPRDLAERGLPFVRPSDQQKLVEQADSFFQALDPISESLGKYAVNVFSNGKMVARGTVVDDGVLTKWSELVARGSDIWVLGHDGVKREARVVAVYLDYDFALLDYGGGLDSVTQAELNESLDLASFMMAVGPSGKAHGFGVLSVAERSLRETDKAFLGVRMSMNPVEGGGVLLEYVEQDSGAGRAGLQQGDVVKRINETMIHGMHEMGGYLQKLTPGTQVDIEVMRDGQNQVVEVLLGARPDLKRFSPERMKQMKRMGGTINGVAEGFPDILQSDMQVEARDAGSPVFDIDGKFVGVVAARSSRIKTYIVSADDMFAELAGEPDKRVEGFTSSQQPLSPTVMNAGENQQLIEERNELLRYIEKAQQRLREIDAAMKE